MLSWFSHTIGNTIGGNTLYHLLTVQHKKQRKKEIYVSEFGVTISKRPWDISRGALSCTWKLGANTVECVDQRLLLV